MASVHGKGQTFTVDDSGGTPRDISANVSSVDFPQIVETADDTAFGDADHSRIVGLKDKSISIEGHFDAAANLSDVVLSGILGQAASVTISYSPDAGTTTYSGEGYLVNYTLTGSVDDLVTFSAEFEGTGAWTRT